MTTAIAERSRVAVGGLWVLQLVSAGMFLMAGTLKLSGNPTMVQMFGDMFRDNAPMTAAEAATVILDGVREGRWRILVGDDAHRLDERVRAEPERAYDGTVSIGELGFP